MVEAVTSEMAPEPGRDSGSAGAVAHLLDWQEAEAISAEWEDLGRCALDPNPFYEPAFALSLAQHAPQERRPRFLAVREIAGEQRLTGLFVLDCSGLQSWNSPFVALGSPLLRQGCAQSALDAVLTWLRADERVNGKDAAGFFHTRMDARSATCRAILTHAVRNALPVQEFDRRLRAALVRGEDGVMREAAGKRRKELGRLLRRLQEKGEVTFATAASVTDVRKGVESFLTLEGDGWKGQRGTALVCNPVHATFARAALRRMAGLSQCRVEIMSLDGEPIAIGLVFLTRDHAAFWKIAFDERYAAYSPGAQLTMAIARTFAQDPSINLVDSCAIPDHPMIDHLWVDRREMIDLFVGAGDVRLFQRAVRTAQARRGLRRAVKSAFLTLTGRRSS